MIPLLDASANLMPGIAAKLNCPSYGQLVTPLTGYRIHDGIFGIDNGGYTKQDPKAFCRLIKRALPHKDRCKFLVAPDVPGSARRTLELFSEFAPAISSLQFPLALACQDGLQDLEIPWSLLSAVFIAGSPDWRKTDCPKHIIAAAKWRGLWVHVGRVSNPEQWEYYRKLGADSADSSALVRPFPGRTDAISKYFKGAI